MTTYMTVSSIVAAAERVRDTVVRTPTVLSPGLSDMLGRTVFLKLENLQTGGSFKARGVLNLLSAFSGERKDYRFAAVSGGNFGIAVAEAAKSGTESTKVPSKSKATARMGVVIGQVSCFKQTARL